MTKEIIKKVLITEKGSVLSVQNRYPVEVDVSATKPQIAKAIEEKFGVHVLAVRTIKMKGATKYIRGTRRTKKESNRKKAYVTVKAGERIEQL